MANAINLPELEQELLRTKRMLDHWSASMLSTAQECKGSHLAKMKSSRGEVAALTERYERAKKQADRVREQMKQDTQHAQERQQAADTLLAEQQALQKRLQQLQRDLDNNTEAVQQLEAEVSDTRSKAQVRFANLQQLHNTYRDCLGLALKSSDGELYLEFTQIDRQQPERPFGFALQVDAHDNYSVTRCCPEVPGRQQLEQQLLVGSKPDLAGFVRAMRQQFQQAASAPAAAGGST